MNRVKQSSVFVVMCLMVILVSYVGFAMRPFYTHPALSFGPDVPADAKSDILEFFASRGGVPVEGYTTEKLFHALLNPLDAYRPRVEFKGGGVGEVWVVSQSFTLGFVDVGGKWELQTAMGYDFDGI